jgi:hypothetical protein
MLEEGKFLGAPARTPLERTGAQERDARERTQHPSGSLLGTRYYTKTADAENCGNDRQYRRATAKEQ